MQNEIVNVTSSTDLGTWTNWALREVATDFQAGMLEFDEYSKKCAMDAMSAIYQLVQTNDKVDLASLDTSNMRDIIKRCAALKLSATAYPREVYFSIRNKKIGDNNYIQQVEMGIEGDGNDSLLRNFGVNVQKVYPCWLVCEGDDFTYPKRKGLAVEPPSWEPKGISSKVVRVVYPIKLKGKDGEDYLIAERSSVKVNLMAHIRQNLMYETFGFCSNSYKAKPDEKAQINAKKEEIFNALRQCETVDDMLNCEIAKPYISPAWLDNSEAMIVRKMRNNATRKFPKDMSGLANQSMIQMDDAYQQSRMEIEEKENATPFIDADTGEVFE